MKVLKRSGTGKRRTGSKEPEQEAAGERETVQTKRKGKAKRGRGSDLSDTIKVNTISGGNGERVPPVPIPNTEVKPLSADGTWLETARESRSPPDSMKGFVERQTPSFFVSLPFCTPGSRWMMFNDKH